MSTFNTQANPGAFLPTTSVWDVATLSEIDVNSDEFKELLVRLYQNINNIALAVNIRDAGYYDQTEFVNGQLFFPNPALSSTTAQTPTFRQVFRKVINFGALPNSTSKSVAHGIQITSEYTFTRIYGCASDTVARSYIPLPSNTTNIVVDATNVTVTTSSNLAAYATTYIILEYIKQ